MRDEIMKLFGKPKDTGSVLVFFYILTNIYILLAFVMCYLTAWHMAGFPVSTKDLNHLVLNLSKEQLSTLVLKSDLADRSLVDLIYSLLYWWLGTAFFSASTVVTYFYLLRKKASPDRHDVL